MSINLSILALINFVGLIIGLSFGLGVILFHKAKKSNIYLGLFIIVYALGFLSPIIESIIKEKDLQELLLSISFSWLLYPLFYIYVQHISSLEVKSIKLPIFIGITGIVLEFFIERYSNSLMSYSFYVKLIATLETLIAIYFGYKTIQWVNLQKKEVYNHFSNVIDKKLNWSKIFIVIGVIYTFVGYLVFVFHINIGSYIYLVTLINVVLLIWISFKSTFQNQIEKTDIINKSITKERIKINQEDIKTSDIITKIDKQIKESQCYKQTDLTIVDLSNLTGIHTKQISHSINSKLNSNFNTFINSYRIDDAKNMLLNADYSNISIEGIGLSVGFQSKSTFYRAFKKETGLTPKEFIKNN